MPGVTLNESLYSSLVSRLGGALDDLKSAGDQPPQEPELLEPDAEIWVNPAEGDDANSGNDRKSPFRTLQTAVKSLKPRSRLMLANGTYQELLELAELGTSADRPIWVKAETPGGATLSNTAPALASGTAPWDHVGGGIYRTPFPGRPWAGFAAGRFLFSYKTLADLKAPRLVDTNKPPYGLAHQDGWLFVRLPEGADPNGQPVMVTASPLARIRRSPYVILDGLAVTGAGNTYAIDTDEQSHHLWMQNVVGDLGRVLVRLPSDSWVRWCQYGYSGLLPWGEETIGMNRSAESVYNLVKRYNVYDHGNAHYEGRIANSFETASRRCRFEHNLDRTLFRRSRSRAVQ